MLVSEILSKHNIHLELSENLLNLDFKGEFDEYHIEEHSKWGIICQCFDEHYAIEITPSVAPCLGYMQHEDKEKNGSVSLYDYDGRLIANTMALPRDF